MLEIKLSMQWQFIVVNTQHVIVFVSDSLTQAVAYCNHIHAQYHIVGF